MSDITKKAIEQSLKHLMLTKPLGKITINDIAKDCGINRMTFYYHFRDIYDLVEWSTERETEKALAGLRTYDTWDEGYLNIFRSVLGNKPYIINIYRSLSREQLERYLNKVTHDIIFPVVEDEAKDMNIKREDIDFITQFYVYSFVGLLLDWIGNNMEEEPEEIVEKMKIMLRGSIHGALCRFADKYRNRKLI